MWFLGQTVKHVETDTPRVYLGVDLSTGEVHFVGTDGEVYQEQGGVPGIRDKYTEYRDTDNYILVGEFAGGTFLGVCQPKIAGSVIPVDPTNAVVDKDPESEAEYPFQLLNTY